MTTQLSLPGLHLPETARASFTAHGALTRYPDVPQETLCEHAKKIGGAGEALFDSVAMRLGFDSLPAPESAAFDRLLLADLTGLRTQIKTTTRPQGRCFVFGMRKGYGGSPRGTRPYETGEFDLTACVILPANAIWFTAERRETHRIDVTRIPRLQAAPFESLRVALAALGIGAGRDAGSVPDVDPAPDASPAPGPAFDA